MLWVVLVIISALLYALSIFIDNYMTKRLFRKKIPEAQKVYDILIWLLAVVFMLIFFDIAPISGLSIIFIISGIVDSIGGIPYFKSLKEQSSISANILLQMMPFYALFFGYVALGQELVASQIFSFVLIFAAAFLTVFSEGNTKIRLRFKSTALMLLAMLIWSVSDAIYVFGGNGLDFVSGFFYVVVGKAAGGVICAMVFKSWRKRAREVFKRQKTRVSISVLANTFLYLTAEVIHHWVLLIAPLALVIVIENTSQLILTFILGIVLTLLVPKFGQEKLNKRSMSIFATATILAIAGIFLLA